MDSADWTIDTEPNDCDHIDIYNFAKVKEAKPLSEVGLRSVSILPYEKPDIQELNDINDDLNTQKRALKLEQARILKMGYESTDENMKEHSNKYEVIMKKINDLEHTAQTLKQRLDQHNSQNSSKTVSYTHLTLPTTPYV